MGVLSLVAAVLIAALGASVYTAIHDPVFMETFSALVSGASSSVQQQHQHNQGQQQQHQQHSSDADPPSLFRVLGPVDAVDCGAAASPAACTATVARSRVPVLLRNTPASEWPAMRKWARLCDGCASCAACPQCERCGEPDLEYLASRIGADAMPAARESTERGARVFVPGQDKDGFLPLELGAEDGSTVVRDVPVDEFMDALTGAARPAGTYRFFSGLLSALQSPELLDDVEPTLPFGLGSDHLATLMWISQRGCVSNTHYDRSANFVVQVAGRKRWLLFPPSEIAVLYTYPSVHRHYHQSRVDIRDPASAERLFPGSSTAEAFEVTLEPGDVLFVPPYWMHLVETLSLSVGVSLVTPSSEEVRHSEVLWHPAPFDPAWSTEERMRHVAGYIRQLVRATEGMTGDGTTGDAAADLFVRRALTEGRWRHFAPRLDEIAARNGTAPLPRSAACTADAARQPAKNAADAERTAKLAKCAAEAAAHLNAVPDPDVRAVGLANLIEELARFAAGGPLRMLDFLSMCF